MIRSSSFEGVCFIADTHRWQGMKDALAFLTTKHDQQTIFSSSQLKSFARERKKRMCRSQLTVIVSLVLLTGSRFFPIAQPSEPLNVSPRSFRHLSHASFSKHLYFISCPTYFSISHVQSGTVAFRAVFHRLLNIRMSKLMLLIGERIWNRQDYDRTGLSLIENKYSDVASPLQKPIDVENRRKYMSTPIDVLSLLSSHWFSRVRSVFRLTLFSTLFLFGKCNK